MPVDIGWIAAAATPILVEGAKAFSKNVGEKVAGKVSELCQTIESKIRGDPYAEQTLARAKEKPESEERQSALMGVLADELESDPDFAEKVSKIIEAIKEWDKSHSVFDQRGQIVHGPQTNIAGDVHGQVLSGNFSGPANTDKSQ